MPTGVYVRTEETRARISAASKGRPSPNKGKHLTEEQKAKLRIANLGKHLTEETKTKISIANKGKHFPSEETRVKRSASMRKKWQEAEYRASIIEKIRITKTDPLYREKCAEIQAGKHYSPESRAKMSANMKELWQNPQYWEHMQAVHKGQPHSEEQNANQRIMMKELWQDPEYIKKVFAKYQPNKAELKLQEILNRRFPGRWKYVGDGQVNLGGRFPDFINVNGRKEVIELFGEHWHPIFHIAQKKEHYKQYGFRVAIIWEDELEDEERLVKAFRKKFLQ